MARSHPPTSVERRVRTPAPRTRAPARPTIGACADAVPGRHRTRSPVLGSVGAPLRPRDLAVRETARRRWAGMADLARAGRCPRDRRRDWPEPCDVSARRAADGRRHQSPDACLRPPTSGLAGAARGSTPGRCPGSRLLRGVLRHGRLQPSRSARFPMRGRRCVRRSGCSGRAGGCSHSSTFEVHSRQFAPCSGLSTPSHPACCATTSYASPSSTSGPKASSSRGFSGPSSASSSGSTP